MKAESDKIAARANGGGLVCAGMGQDRQGKQSAVASCLLQEDDFDNDEWQDVPGAGISSGVVGAAAVAGGMQSAGQQGVGDAMEDEDEEWEEV